MARSLQRQPEPLATCRLRAFMVWRAAFFCPAVLWALVSAFVGRRPVRIVCRAGNLSWTFPGERRAKRLGLCLNKCRRGQLPRRHLPEPSMNASSQASNQSNWQHERAAILQRACQSIKRAKESGKPLGRAIQRNARSYAGSPFKSDPERRLKLSPVTMRRLWDAWRRSGELPTAFKFNFFQPRPSAVTAPMLVAFAEFCARNSLKSLRAAWLEFIARPGERRHRRNKNGRPVSYDMVNHHFGTDNFYLLQDCLKTIKAAQIELARRRLAIIDGIQRRLPSRAPRRSYVRRPNDFQI